MCGICGIFDTDPARAVRPEVVERMATSISHRGPDDAGFRFEPGLALGHRRLSIIDISSGQQPMTNEDETVWIVFNGEIYNFTELRNFLIAKGHRFRTQSDTEAIVHLYEEVGEECFARLRGMFAIALWDRRRRRLLLARDRIGKKPLFYSWSGQRLVFGSELKAVLAAGDLERSIDFSALADYFSCLYVPAPKSIYREVRKVRPGHYLVTSAEGIREQEYWDLRFGEVAEKSVEQWSGELREALTDSVRVRLMSEVPLGSFLSGGLDSSAVVATMSRIMNQPVTACAIGFENEAFNEVEYAREVARHVRADYHEETVRPDAMEIVERLAWHYDEPFADSSAIPTYYVSKAAREQVTVALTGDGGDESFVGYKRYVEDWRDNQIRNLFPAWLRRGVIGPLGRWYPKLERAPRIFRAKSTLQSIAQDPLEGYLRQECAPIEVLREILSPDVLRQLGNYEPRDLFRDYYKRSGGPDHISRIQYLDIKTYLPDDICAKVDRASMAVSLEVRCPFLDHQLMELVARMPSQIKLHNGSTKYILKEAIRDLLPPSILNRRKQGFGVPIGDWFRGVVKDVAYATLFDPKDGVLNERFLRNAWELHQSRVRDMSGFLWAVFVFRQWQSLFQENAIPPAAPKGTLAEAAR